MTEFTSKSGKTFPVRRVEAGDEKKLQAFNNSLGEKSRELFTPHMYDDATVGKVVERSGKMEDSVFIALDGDTVAAYFFLWYAKRRVSLLGIGVADAYQGEGLGKLAMQALVEEGKKLGLDGIELTTATDNDRAFALYRKIGFKYIGDVDNVVGDGSIKVERCMFLPLKEGAEPMTEKHAPPV